MAARSNWEGFLQFNLISVPIKAYSATVVAKGRIGFHLIHEKCGSRIRYQKVCPIHGEVSNDEIVSGYEQSKGEYVTVKKDEIDKLKADNDKSITIDAFVSPDAINPIYGSGRSFYLTPDGKGAQRPYAVLQKAMAKQNRCALAQMVFSGREQVGLVRATNGLLVMTLLFFDEQLKKPASFTDELADVNVAGKELELAETLIDTATVKELDFSKYKDLFTGKVAKLLASKNARIRKTPARGDREAPHIINLMDALKQSIATAKKGAGKGKKHRRTG